jgi:hypothetical protein
VHQLATAAAQAWQADSRKEDEDLANLKRILQCQWALVQQHALIKTSAGGAIVAWSDGVEDNFKMTWPSNQDEVLELLPPDAKQLVQNKHLTMELHHPLSYLPTPGLGGNLRKIWRFTWKLDVHSLANDKLEELRNEEVGLPPAKRAKKQEDATTSTTADAINAKAKKQATDAAKRARREATKLDKAATKAETAAEYAERVVRAAPNSEILAAQRDARTKKLDAVETRLQAELADINAIALEGKAAGFAADGHEEVLD